MEKELELIKEYFNKGNTYDVIHDMLSTHHDIKMWLWRHDWKI